MMRQFIDLARSANAVLHPEALRELQQDPQGLETLRRALASNPFIITAEVVKGHRAPAPSPVLQAPFQARTAHALMAAVAAATAPAPPQAPRPVPMPLLPPQPLAAPAARPTPLLAPALDGPTRLQAMAASLAAHPAAQVAHGIPDAPRLADLLPAPTVEVLKDITGKSTCTGELTDFTRYFNDRLNVTRRILKQRRDLAGAVNIEDIPRSQTGIVKLIGIVNEVRVTKNGYRILELEDKTGVVPILVRKNDGEGGRSFEFGDDPERVMQDEVIGVVAKAVAGKDILYLEGLFHPDVELDHAPQRSKEPALACFISDVHFGAKTFLDPMWERFVRWLNGQEGTPEARARAAQVKYLVVAGDVVDGVGVYPGQEHELAIPDIEGQYQFCAQQFARLPSRVRIIMLPGNHDAVRPAEPQPAMGERHTKGYKDNVTFVGNPATVNLQGVEVLAYHGVSLIDYITALRGLDVHKPIKIMEEILKRRHIAPMYGGHTPVAPEARDYLVIDRVPDIFVTGHLHTCDVGDYKGVTLINAGTWQGQTSYQKTLGIMPEPARVPMVDLASGARTVLRFDQEITATAA